MSESDPGAPTSSDLLHGIDVSAHQGAINWARVAAAGKEFVWAKVTEGATLTDRCFTANWRGARGEGLRVGGYHYLAPRTTAEEQANHFLDVYGPYHDDATLPPVLDIEIAAGGELPAATVDRALTWARLVEVGLGTRPWVYTYTYFALDHFRGPNAVELASYRLWVACYRDAPLLPPPWSRWSAWQHTSKGSVDGIAGPVDLDCLRVEALEDVVGS